MNPLLEYAGLPRFSDVRVEHVTPAIDQLLAENRASIEQLRASSESPTWENFVQPLEDTAERLGRAWGQVTHLHAVMNTPELREVYNANLPKVTQYHSELSQDAVLYEKYKALRAGQQFETLASVRKKIIADALRDFRLGGAELPPEKKQRYMAIQEELAALAAKFEQNLLDATNAYALYIETRGELDGMPEDVLQAAQEEAQRDGKSGWKLTLRAPSYLPVMQYARNRNLRETLYRAYSTRASELDGGEHDNAPLIRRILELRQEEAQLLGYTNFAEVSLVPKMAGSAAEVLKFLDDLARRAKPYAERDVEELRAFARAELALDPLQPWDIPYASEMLRVNRYAFSDQEVKQYFPEDVVLSGMFQLVESIYAVRIERSEAPVWHPDVKFFAVRDRNEALIGQFYLDLYARPSKRGGAWMDDAIARRRKNGAIQTPVTYLTCNFSAPVGGKPALFTHDEVMTLFHEFGHGLHHLLTRVDDLGASGLNGVEWDAVELPSQFMENFCWEWEVLARMTQHVDSGAPLPRALFDKMIAAKNFQSGMQMVRQLEFSLFDMRLHAGYALSEVNTPQALLDQIRREVAVVIPPPYNRFANSFSHIFAGGYGAGYYSYKWAEVLSADAYSLFEELGVLNAEAGRRFRDEILSVGGGRPAAESFRAFRGRAPSIDALLRHNGMTDMLAA